MHIEIKDKKYITNKGVLAMNNSSTNKKLISNEEELISIMHSQIREIIDLNQAKNDVDKKQPLYPVWDPTQENLSVLKKMDNVYGAIRMAAVYIYHKNVGMSEYNRRTSYTLQGYSQKMTVPALWQILQPVLNIKRDSTTSVMINIDRQQFDNMIEKLVKLYKPILDKARAKQEKEKLAKRQLAAELARERQLVLAKERQRKIIENWEKLFRECFNIEDIDLSDIRVPQAQGNINFPIYVPRGLTYDQLWEACKTMFNGKVWIHNGPAWDDRIDLLSSTLSLSKEERTAKNGSYCVLCRNRQMADEENKDKTAAYIAKHHILTITLMERLLFGLYYYRYTGEHLDVGNWTLCSGSRSETYVPWVSWHASGIPEVPWHTKDVFSIHWFEPNVLLNFVRARSIVSN